MSNPADSPLTVALDCRINDFRQGVGTAFIALVREFASHPQDSEEFTLIIPEDQAELFREFEATNNMKLLLCPGQGNPPLRNALKKVPMIPWVWRQVAGTFAAVPHSDGLIEARGFDIVHFPTQVGYLTSVPSIYQPWDLQHIHLPKYFTHGQRAQRDRNYRALCGQASTICIQTEWGKTDLITQYGIAPGKIEVVPWGSVFEGCHEPEGRDFERVAQRFALADRFLLFPAVTWPHKNHQLLIRALSQLRREGLSIPLVCTGRTTPESVSLLKLAQENGVADLIRFIGFVDPIEMQVLYRSATAMVYPSRFEGFGLPLNEAFHAGLPVLCSRASVLPEVAGDAALFFDVDDPAEAATAIRNICSSPQLRDVLIQRGRRRLAENPMSETAQRLRAVYRKAFENTIEQHQRRRSLAIQ